MSYDPDHHDMAFDAARAAVPELDPAALQRAITAYLDELHIHVRRVHDDTPLTAEQALDAFRPRDVEF